MNFRYMPELDWPFGYAYALGLMVLSSAALYVVFKKRGWL
jgi:magnesium transporter